MEINLLDIIEYKNIIDIRDNYSYKLGKIMNAKLIDERLLVYKPELFLKKDEEYYIYCEKGINSKRVSKMLVDKGYKVYSIIGGYEAYLKAKNSKII